MGAKEVQPGREGTHLALLMGGTLGETPEKRLFLGPPNAEDAPCHRLLCEGEFAAHHGAEYSIFPSPAKQQRGTAIS